MEHVQHVEIIIPFQMELVTPLVKILNASFQDYLENAQNVIILKDIILIIMEYARP
jgi:hypothetical protein